MAGWAHPPGLLHCGGPLHLLGAHSLGLLSRLLEKESTGVKLCTDTGIGSTLKSLFHPQAVPTLLISESPTPVFVPRGKRSTLLPLLPEVSK